MQYCGIPFYLSADTQCAQAWAGSPLLGYRQKTKSLSVSTEHTVHFNNCFVL